MCMQMNESVVTTATVEDPTIETKLDQQLLSSPPNKSTPTETPTVSDKISKLGPGGFGTYIVL